MQSSKVQRSKGLHERFARFFEEPRREHLRELLRDTAGEYSHLDFKKEWPETWKLVKHVLGLANSGGGCLVIGVEDDPPAPVGVPEIKDKAKIVASLQPFLPSGCLRLVDIHDFRYSESEYPVLIGKSFQVVMVEDDPEALPFLALKESGELKPHRVYVRRGTSTEEASYDELQSLLNRRIETGYSSRKELDLEVHFRQLQVLYGQISRNVMGAKGWEYLVSNFDLLGFTSAPNPRFPKEDLTDFVVRMITAKKKLIERVLGLTDK